MKHYKLITWSILVSLVIFQSCNKNFLDKYPLSEVSPQNFFNTENDLLLYTNSFYTVTSGHNVFTGDIASDNVEQNSVNQLLEGNLQVPETASQAGWTWSELRNINIFLQNYHRASTDESIKNHYAGVARFFRAWFYFEKMKRFGNVPWYSLPLETNSPELYKGRDSRVLITDSIIADLDFAIEHLNTTKNVSRVNKWTALALKSRVCLFEGTFRKYHTYLSLEGTHSALLEQAAEAAESVIDGNQYKLYSTNNPQSDYLNLFSADQAKTDEVIFAEIYDTELMKFHAANHIFNVATTGGGVGLTKDLVDSYLMIDGRPFSTVAGSTEFTFYEETRNRDPRLAQTMRTPGYRRIGGSQTLLPDFSTAPTGYQVIKFVSGVDQDAYNTNSNDVPLFRYAEVLLNYAEAKAELGDFTQSDANRSINLIRKRAGLPDLHVDAILPDPTLRAQYPNIDDKLLEVRRERRVELVMEGFRYYDILRWKRGKKFEEVFRGMYFPSKGEYDLDGNDTIDFAIVDALPNPQVPGVQYFVLGTRQLSDADRGNILIAPNVKKTFTEPKNYLYPLPRQEMVLNEALKPQNEGWGD